MGTPQVFPLLWGNNQGQNATGGNKPPPWDPKALPPSPIDPNIREAKPYQIVQDQANPGKTPLETELDKVQQHNNVAANTLCQKNRKRKQSSLELPFDPTIEEGTVYQLQGFAKNFDGKWLITEVQYSFAGKGGSRLSLELMQCLDPPNKTPGAGAHAAAGANGKKPITVPQQPTQKTDLLHDAGINSITPQPANVANLTLSGNEIAPTWLNAHGQLNSDQQDLNAENAGPTG